MIDKIINIYNLIINVFNYLISFIGGLFVHIYSFLCDILVEFYDFTFKYLYILDSDIRRDIFIGVTGLTIAIIIFIAEVVSNKKYELDKKLILKKTGIKRNILFCIIIFFMMFLSLMFKSSYHKEVTEYYIICDIVYYLIQLVLNFLIIVYMALAVRIFCIAVKLNTDSDYFGEELDKFLNKKTIEIEKKHINKMSKGLRS